MTDTSNAPENASANALPQIGVNVQYIKDFSIENPNAPEVFKPSEEPPAMNMGVNVQTRAMPEQNTFEVVLMLRLEAKVGEKVAFIAEMAYAGIFTVPAVPDDQLRFVLMAEAPRYLFPFARAFMASAVREAGFPQVLINPIDFFALYQNNLVNLEQPAKTEA